MAMCPLRSRLIASPKAFHVRSSQPNVCRLVTVDFRPDGAVGIAAFRNASVNDHIALLVKEAAEVRGLVDKQDASIAKQDARIAKQGARIAKQDAKIAKQDARIAKQDSVILVIGEDKVINVATQVNLEHGIGGGRCNLFPTARLRQQVLSLARQSGLQLGRNHSVPWDRRGRLAYGLFTQKNNADVGC